MRPMYLSAPGSIAEHDVLGRSARSMYMQGPWHKLCLLALAGLISL